MLSEARQKKIMEKLNKAQKCSILGPQNLGSRGAQAPEDPLDLHLHSLDTHYPGHTPPPGHTPLDTHTHPWTHTHPTGMFFFCELENSFNSTN